MNKNWKIWMKILGRKSSKPRAPMMRSKTVSISTLASGADTNAKKGVYALTSENFIESVSLTKTDPFLANSGSIRVSLMMDVK